MSDGPPVPPLAAEDHTCAECGLSYPALTLDAARAIIGSLPEAADAVLGAASPRELRRRPAPERWSALEYLCHLRDVCVTSTIRVHRARTEDRPVLDPMLNDLRARRFRYNERSLDGVRAELAACAAGLGEEIGRLTPADGARLVTRLPGEHRTARWLVRQAAHEVVHHLADIEHCLSADIRDDRE
ncbi:DinB family protein [Amycolatopsis sp. OK19-0408]|uniref:DinB family protein n=1 Tax=Amycolatopsis iheyensis TaxID=2945988 RepID=A0A9X2N9F2_9PSEU|nr:DinB family protein [Amycolatopsis iheyensis]MCR6482855.1 DinB family protein [Amycolatopsis iheyensis]